MTKTSGWALWVPLAAIVPSMMAHAEPIDLPEIKIEDSSPGEVLNEDALVPALRRQVSPFSGTGQLQKGLLDEVPLSSASYGGAGTSAQFRGLGRSATETQVQALGVGLNPPQGGGFDFSTFPQYFWSGFSFQLTPGMAALDPRATSGVISLVPWTESALAQAVPSNRATAMVAFNDLQQVSIGARVADRLALLVGNSSGVAQGPSGGLSGRFGEGSVRGRYHLLATDLETRIPGPASARTPRARQTTARVMPIVQADFDLQKEVVLKTGLFYDVTYLASDTPETPDRSRDHILQAGLDAALLVSNWKLGALLRRADYDNLYEAGGAYPYRSARQTGETLLDLQVTPMFVLGSLQIEPSLTGVSVTSYGMLPAGSVGVRYPIGEQALFARGSFSRRYPTLLDRFGAGNGYRGNPDLEVEKDWTGIVGWEANPVGAHFEVQLYRQLREDAIQSSGAGATPSNLDEVEVNSLLHNARVRVGRHLALTEAGAWAHSRIRQTGARFPYQPALVQILGWEVFDRFDDPCWSASAKVRAQTAVIGPRFDPVTSASDPNFELPGWGYLDLAGSARLGSLLGVETVNVDLFARIENVFDRKIEFQQDYPSEGRIVTLGLLGHL